MRGRKPKPAAVKIVEGDARKVGKRKLAEALSREPVAVTGLPGCPRHLRGRARAAWVFWVEQLEAMKLDKRPDAQALEGACVNYARAVEADLLLRKEGLTVEDCVLTEEGEKVVLKVKAHPAVNISNQAWRQVRSFCGEFGFTPVSRTRLSAPKAEGPVDDLMSLLDGPRAAREQPVM